MFLREKPSISNQHVPNCWVFLLYQIYEMIRSVDNREVYNPVIVFISFESFTRGGGGGGGNFLLLLRNHGVCFTQKCFKELFFI